MDAEVLGDRLVVVGGVFAPGGGILLFADCTRLSSRSI